MKEGGSERAMDRGGGGGGACDALEEEEGCRERGETEVEKMEQCRRRG